MLLSLIPFGNSQNLNDHRAIRTIFSGSNFSSGISQAVARRRFIKKNLFLKISQNSQATLVLEFLFNKAAGLHCATS